VTQVFADGAVGKAPVLLGKIALEPAACYRYISLHIGICREDCARTCRVEVCVTYVTYDILLRAPGDYSDCARTCRVEVYVTYVTYDLLLRAPGDYSDCARTCRGEVAGLASRSVVLTLGVELRVKSQHYTADSSGVDIRGAFAVFDSQESRVTVDSVCVVSLKSHC